MFAPILPERTQHLSPPGRKAQFRQPQTALRVESLVELQVELQVESPEALSEALSEASSVGFP